MKAVKIIVEILFFVLLTVLTQVGGVIYMFSKVTHRFIEKRTSGKALQILCKGLAFLIFYITITMWVVPLIARPFGRVPLLWRDTHHVRPLTILTCLLNRHYVTPELKQTVYGVAEEMNQKFAGTKLNYLDANLPFWDKFPLVPHLSHDDGRKLDLSFCYLEASTGQRTNACPSFIGYGVYEEPAIGEVNAAQFCDQLGYWQYGILSKVTFQKSNPSFMLDADRTKALVNLFAEKEAIGKIFIEPHLKTRLNLSSPKVRFHGCKAVRHDDHIHIQLKSKRQLLEEQVK